MHLTRIRAKERRLHVAVADPLGDTADRSAQEREQARNERRIVESDSQGPQTNRREAARRDLSAILIRRRLRGSPSIQGCSGNSVNQSVRRSRANGRRVPSRARLSHGRMFTIVAARRTVVFATTFVLVFNLIVDVLVPFVDPRIGRVAKS